MAVGAGDNSLVCSRAPLRVKQKFHVRFSIVLAVSKQPSTGLLNGVISEISLMRLEILERKDVIICQP
jgi:hypothetical protein